MGKEKQEKINVHGGSINWVRLKYSGLYDIEKLMGAARQWFLDHKYIVIESEHSEAVKGSGREIRFEWKPERKVTDYIKFMFEFEVVILREVDVVVEEQGRKNKMQQGDLELRFRTAMAKNYRKTFKGVGKEFLRQTYEKYLIKRELEGYEAKLNSEGDEFWDLMKQVLGSFKR